MSAAFAAMKSYGKRGGRAAWAHKRSLCVLWLLFLSASWLCFRGTQSTHGGCLTDIRATADKGAIGCRSANVSVAVTSTFMNTFIKAAVIPMIQNDSNTLIVPQQEVNHVWVDKMVLQHFKLGSLTVSTGVPDAQSMMIRGTGLGLKVNKSRFIFHYMGVRCSGTFWASLKETAVDAVIRLTLLPEERWNVTFPRLALDWGQVDVHHELDSETCSLAQKVVELFTGELDVFVVSKVKRMLDEEMPRKAADRLNDAFARFGIRAITPPVMTANAMAVTLDLNPLDFGCASTPTASTVPELVSRDIAARTTATSVNNVLYNAVQAQRLQVEKHLSAMWNTSLLADLFPELYRACPGCRLYTLAQATKAPIIDVLRDGEVSVDVHDLILGVYVQPNSSEHSSALSSLITEKQLRPRAGFSAAYRSFERKKRISSQYHRKAFPVLAIGCSAASGVRNISASTGHSISYELLPVRDVAVKVMASNIGDVSTKDLEKLITKVWNDFAAPLANSASPLKLPFFFQEAVLKVGPDIIEGGVNVSLKEEFLQAVLSTL
ncbi:expression site-associated protein 5 (ESAG5), putative [Leishmania donovani]|uniref:Expression site-associated protein 5 (ESAG5), putative n=1 Tax=Leishmania donovani TaxID=5661 RepID=A0A3S5H7X9_LEIDO|nr:expression site-associated protein 5 (ESAG5), putative [Leishmania donovani]